MQKLKEVFPPPLIALIFYIIIILLIILGLKKFTFLAAPVFFALIIAYLFNPLVSYVKKKTSLSRSLISSVLVFILVLAFSFLVGTLLPDFIERIENAAVKLPQLLKLFSEKIEVFSNYLTKNFSQYIGDIDIMGSIESAISRSLNNLSDILIRGFSSLYGAFMILVFLVLTPLFAYYFLKDYYKIKSSLFGLIPGRLSEKFLKRIDNMNNILSSFIRGQAIVVLILALLYSIGLSLIGLPFPVLIGILSGIGDIIPYMGTAVGFTISIIVGIAYFQSFEKLLLIVLIFAVVKGSENWFFYPKIVGREVGLHFFWVLASIIVFGRLFGFWGLLIAIPAAAGFKVFLTDLVDYYKHSSFFKKK
ncbi:MAG: AI-2E family transporter [Candidatus Aminicenantes bacterium]|nr:AI-2E family transporter [Candidatus Aminicenantes bacterium]